MVQLAFVHVTGNLRVGVPQPVASKAVRVAAGDCYEQFVLLSYVVQDLRFWLAEMYYNNHSAWPKAKHVKGIGEL